VALAVALTPIALWHRRLLSSKPIGRAALLLLLRGFPLRLFRCLLRRCLRLTFLGHAALLATIKWLDVVTVQSRIDVHYISITTVRRKKQRLRLTKRIWGALAPHRSSVLRRQVK